MTEAALRDRLLAAVPAFDDADWLDVRRRAAAIQARRRHRRLLALAAALAVLTALIVNPALGIGERLLSFVEGDPAPESVQKEFTLGVEPPAPLRIGDRVIERPTTQRPPPDLADAHLALALESSHGPVYLWMAPMTGGGKCTLLEVVESPKPPPGQPRGGVNCGPHPPAERPIEGGETGDRVDGDYLHLTVGEVHPRITRLELALSDGRVVPVRLVEGFFLAELPAGTLAERVPGCQEPEMPPSILPQRAPPPRQDPEDVVCLVNVIEYRGFDRTGALVERYRVPKPDFIRPIEPFKTALTARLFSGQKIRIEYARAERNRLCFRLLWDAGMAQGGCSVHPKRALPNATIIGSGKKQTFFLSGPVGSDVARLELVWDDGSTERLRIENGFTFKQIDPFGSRFPSKLVGSDEAGRVIAERSALGGPG